MSDRQIILPLNVETAMQISTLSGRTMNELELMDIEARVKNADVTFHFWVDTVIMYTPKGILKE